MEIITEKITHDTKGSGDLIDITSELNDLLEKSTLMDGNMIVFVSGSTAGITTFEFEPGMIKDIKEFYESSPLRAPIIITTTRGETPTASAISVPPSQALH